MNKEMNNIMLDVETLGTGYNPVILSIGAVFFDELNTGEDFYTEIKMEDALKHKQNVTASTIYWWMEQVIKQPQHLNLFNSESKANKTTVSEALFDFYKFCTKNKPEPKQTHCNYWAWGMSDFFWLESCIENSSVNSVIKPPWKYNKRYDLRTIAHNVINKPQYDDTLNDLIAHNALDDCLSQIKYFQQLLFLNPNLKLSDF